LVKNEESAGGFADAVFDHTLQDCMQFDTLTDVSGEDIFKALAAALVYVM